jgi:hypothetical protein
MPVRLLGLIDEAARWGPAAPVAFLFAVAVFEALVLPRRLWMKMAWVLAVALCGLTATMVLRAQQQAGDKAVAERQTTEVAALRGLWSQWDQLSHSLPPSSADVPEGRFDSLGDALASLSAKVASIADQIAELKAAAKGRSVDAETALKLADYLRQYGSYRVVLSCPPNDLEAYTYANQLANILRAAGWDANGPEATTGPGERPAMGISLYVRNQTAPGAAKILIDAFGRFNIPYQSGIAEDAVIPDQTTVELYVAKKP